MQCVDFETAPAVGTILKLDDQEYVLVEVRDYRRTDGNMSNLLVWHSNCPTCGVLFETITGLRAQSLSRRCAEHRAGMKPVKGHRGRKVKIGVIHA